MNPYALIGIFAAIALVFGGSYKCGSDAGVRRDAERSAKIITAKDAELQTCLTAKADAEDQVVLKGREIEGLKTAAEAREAEVAEERRKAQGQITFFRKRAAEIALAKPSSPDMCAAAQALAVKTLSEERQ